MAKITLAGYDNRKEEDRAYKRMLEMQGHTVNTYNPIKGVAQGINLRSVVNGSDEVVNMSSNTPKNSDFHRAICRLAGEYGATVSRR